MTMRHRPVALAIVLLAATGFLHLATLPTSAEEPGTSTAQEPSSPPLIETNTDAGGSATESAVKTKRPHPCEGLRGLEKVLCRIEQNLQRSGSEVPACTEGSVENLQGLAHAYCRIQELQAQRSALKEQMKKLHEEFRALMEKIQEALRGTKKEGEERTGEPESSLKEERVHPCEGLRGLEKVLCRIEQNLQRSGSEVPACTEGSVENLQGLAHAYCRIQELQAQRSALKEQMKQWKEEFRALMAQVQEALRGTKEKMKRGMEEMKEQVKGMREKLQDRAEKVKAKVRGEEERREHTRTKVQLRIRSQEGRTKLQYEHRTKSY